MELILFYYLCDFFVVDITIENSYNSKYLNYNYFWTKEQYHGDISLSVNGKSYGFPEKGIREIENVRADFRAAEGAGLFKRA